MQKNSYNELRARNLICCFYQDKEIVRKQLVYNIYKCANTEDPLDYPLSADEIQFLQIPLEDKAWLLFLMLNAEEIEIITQSILGANTRNFVHRQALSSDLTQSRDSYQFMARVFSSYFYDLRNALKPQLCEIGISTIKETAYVLFNRQVFEYEKQLNMENPVLPCKADFSAIQQPFSPHVSYRWNIDLFSEWRCNDCDQHVSGDFLVSTSTARYARMIATYCESCVIKFFEQKGIY